MINKYTYKIKYKYEYEYKYKEISIYLCTHPYALYLNDPIPFTPCRPTMGWCGVTSPAWCCGSGTNRRWRLPLGCGSGGRGSSRTPGARGCRLSWLGRTERRRRGRTRWLGWREGATLRVNLWTRPRLTAGCGWGRGRGVGDVRAGCVRRSGDRWRVNPSGAGFGRRLARWGRRNNG